MGTRTCTVAKPSELLQFSVVTLKRARERTFPGEAQSAHPFITVVSTNRDPKRSIFHRGFDNRHVHASSFPMVPQNMYIGQVHARILDAWVFNI